jgi:hypothetical protein
METVEFNPSRQAIRVGSRIFLLDLNVSADGTGVVRLFRVESSGSMSFLGAFAQFTPGGRWHVFDGSGATPREAALDFLHRSLGGHQGSPRHLPSPPNGNGFQPSHRFQNLADRSAPLVVQAWLSSGARRS